MAATTFEGIAIWLRRATIAESSPPLNPTTSPRALAAVTCWRIQSTRSDECPPISNSPPGTGHAELSASFLRHRLLRLALLDHAHEGIDESGVELPSTLAIDLGDGLGNRPGRLVWTLLRQRVEDVGDRHNSSGQWNVGAPDSNIA